MMKRMGGWRRLAAVGASLAVLGGLAGCSGNSGGASSPSRASTSAAGVGQRMAPNLTALFQQALKDPKLTPFEREVLTRAARTGRISDADYEEMHNRYARCMKDLGFPQTFTKMPNGIYQIQGSVPADMDEKTFHDTYNAATLKCSYPAIDALYKTQQGNPDLLANPYEVAVRCLVKIGAVPPSYTTDALKADLRSDLSGAPFTVSDPQVNNCLYSAGFAIRTGQ
jgi:hypothetical protein